MSRSETNHRLGSKWIRSVAVLSTGVAAAVCFAAAPAGAATIHHGTVHPDPALPNCGGAIELLKLGYTEQTFAFKLQALSGALNPWITAKEASGTMKWQAGVLDEEVLLSGQVGASRTQGASIPRQQMHVPTGKEANIEAEIFVGNSERCVQDFITLPS
jgi:hypothetical protein